MLQTSATTESKHDPDSHATYINISEGGAWREIVNPDKRLVKERFFEMDNTARFNLSFIYVALDKSRRRAQAAAIMFSDGTIWDNRLEMWR